MPRYNANQLQGMYPVTRATIGRWIKKEMLASDQNNYVDHNEFTKVFYNSVAGKKFLKSQNNNQANNTPELPLSERNQVTGEVLELPNMASTPSEAYGNGGNGTFAGAKPELQNLKLQEEIKEKRIKNAKEAGRLIDRKLVSKFVGQMSEIDSTEWRSLSARVVDEVMAICEVSDAEKQTSLIKRIDEEVYAILSSVQRSQREFLELILQEGDA